MRRFVPLFLFCSAAFATQIFRIDPPPVMTTAGNAPVGGSPALYAVSNAAIQICTDTACSTPATTYTDATGGTACPSYAPVVTKGTNICTSTTDAQGNFGFWLAPGTYYYKIVTSGGQTFGNYPITSNTAGVITFNGRAGAVAPTTGDYTAAMVTNAVDSTGTYSNPAWITALALTKLTGLSADTFAQGTGTTPQAGALPNCTAAGCVYQYSTSTHLFGPHILVGADIPAIDLTAGGNGGATGVLPVAKGGTGGLLPVANGGTGVTAAQGNGSKVQLSTGSPVSGDCAKFDASGNTADSGAPCNALPTASASFSYLRTKYNSTTTYEFSALPQYNAADYNFSAITPSSPATLTGGGGAQTITLPTCPVGVSGSAFAPIYISAGVGTPEAVTPSGGTCVSGAAGGTLVVSPLNNHSGAWTVSSGTGGLQETFNAASVAGGGKVSTANATITPHATTTVPATGTYALDGGGSGTLTIARASDFPNGDVILVPSGATVAIQHLGINNHTAATQSSGAAIDWAVSSPIAEDTFVSGGFLGYLYTRASVGHLVNTRFYSGDAWTRAGIQVVGQSNVNSTDLHFSGGLVYNVAGTNCIRLQGADSVWFENFSLGFSSASAVAMVPDAGYSVINIDLGSSELDSPGAEGIALLTLAGGAVIGNVRIHDNHILAAPGTNATTYGIDIATLAAPQANITDVQVVNNQFINWGDMCIAATGTGVFGNFVFSGNTFRNCNSNNHAGHGSMWLVASNGWTLDSNTSAGGADDYYDILLSTSATNLTIQGGNLSQAVTAPINFNGISPAGNFAISTVAGIWSNVSGTVADAAALALPVNNYFTLTGTGTTVTSFTGFGVQIPGRTWTLVPTNASPPAFTAGATIGNSCAAPVQNYPYTLVSDGTKVFIYGKGC